MSGIKNLNLFTIKFPITAIVSILHRISGVVIFLTLPIIIWYWNLSLISQDGFSKVYKYCSCGLFKITFFLTFSAIIYHFIAGIRHIIMDFGYAESKCASKFSSILVFIISAGLIITTGVLLW